MSSSLRARRMARNHRRLAQQPRLNLVALMDIFTILVLFLMVNNGDVEVLQPDRAVVLPESVSEQRPDLALTIKVSDTEILLAGRPVSTVESALAGEDNSLPDLSRELTHQLGLLRDELPQEPDNGHPVIIMGDQGMPYELLKRIMTTCAEQGFRDISLAVTSKPLPLDSEPQLAQLGSGP